MAGVTSPPPRICKNMLEKRPILVREKNLSIPQGQLKIKINLEGSTILVEKEKILPSKRAQNS